MDTLSDLKSGALAGRTRLTLREGLTDFPREVFGLADTLEILDLSGNRLSELPGDLDRLPKLRILFCSENDFTHLPAVLGRCPALQMTGFKGNRIETVDEAALPATLRWLILTDNRVARLPGSISKCTNLQKLMLAGNRLTELPAEMAACRMLELIRLSANHFHSFPDWLCGLPRLSWLGLAGNPGEPVPTGERIREIPWTDLRLDKPLGEGASGVIHRALWTTEDRTVAVKVFKGAMTSDGLPEREMATCAAAGDHPNLIGVLGRIRDHPDGSNGLVMPLIDPAFVNLADPPDLNTCTRDRYAVGLRFAPATVLKMAQAMASAACHLHEKGIAHGDLYAHNILWNGNGDCLLGDFGAASFYQGGTDLERIEVRAFACLLEELMNQGDFGAGGGEMLGSLWKLHSDCNAEEVPKRPAFKEIRKRLDLLHFFSGIPKK